MIATLTWLCLPDIRSTKPRVYVTGRALWNSRHRDQKLIRAPSWNCRGGKYVSGVPNTGFG